VTASPSPVAFRRLLVVDDEPHIWLVLRPHLTDLGYHLDVARTLADGRAALAGGGPFDAVLLDLHLPDGSGLDLLRERPAGGPPVLVLTGEAEDRVLDEVRALGAELLTKPFSPSKLAARIAGLARAPGDSRP
jgi:DNA-binding response OmpR family regulator